MDSPKILTCYLLTPYTGVQGGPLGGERCVIIPMEGGDFGCIIYNGPDDAPGTPSGEFWIQRHDVNTEASEQNKLVRIQKDGATRIGAETKVVVLAPAVNLGAENLTTDDGLVTMRDLQAAINGVKQVNQNAFNSLCQRIACGQGVPPPNIADVAAQASTSVFASE